MHEINRLYFLARLLARNGQTTNTKKMKKKFKISTLIIGIIVAVIAFSNSNTFAGSLENKEVTELKTLDVEILELMQGIIDEKNENIEDNKCIKFYNSNKKLVYECRDKNDDRLKILLRRSDLVLQTDTSSYYLLGN